MGAVTNPELIGRYQAAKKAGNAGEARRVMSDLVKHNSGLARNLVRRWAKPQTEEDSEDAFQAACMGVMRAVELFDLDRGTSFSTYAGHQIRAHIQQWAGKTSCLSRPRGATMPASLAERARIIRNSQGREPTAEDLGVSEAQLTEWSEGALFVELDAGNSDDEDGRAARLAFQLASDPQEAKHTIDKMALEAAWTEAIADISERNAKMAEGVLWNGRTLRDVGAEFGLSHVEVARYVTRVEDRLKRAVKRASGPPSSRPSLRENGPAMVAKHLERVAKVRAK